jgi:hypothetical protein
LRIEEGYFLAKDNMKFGRKYVKWCSSIEGLGHSQPSSLPRNQVPEWSSAYINYKGLKKLIKAAANNAKEGKDVDLAGMTLLSD